MARIDFVTGNAQIYLPEVEALAAVPDSLEQVLEGHAATELRRGSALGGATPSRVIGDLIAYAERDHVALHRMAWMTDPVLVESLDYAGIAATEGWEAQDARALLARFTSAIAEAVDLLKDQPDAAWGRPGLFETGRRSIRQQVQTSIEHYADEIGRLRGALRP